MFVDMTVQEASKHLASQLTGTYELSEAAEISELVIEHITGTKRAQRINIREKQLGENEMISLESYLQRLLANEPVQYVLTEAWFCGMKFYVDKNVLIPRPETEELVEWIITDCKFPISTLSILDIGSGSGCIAITLKKRLGRVDVWSCDISTHAIAIAGKNASSLGIDVKFMALDFLDKDQTKHLPAFDIIVSNPPYVPENDKATMHPNVRDHEPATALFVPNNDPLVFYAAIAEFGKEHLTDRGLIYTEIHEQLGKPASELFSSNGYETKLKKDMQGKERMLKAYF